MHRSFGEAIAIRKRGFRKDKWAAKIVPSWEASEGEIAIWPKLQHENILPLTDTVGNQGLHIFIMPLLRTSLENALMSKNFKRSKKSFELSRKWLAEILQELKYLRRKELCHMDLKTDNVLITSNTNPVICDFAFINRTYRHTLA